MTDLTNLQKELTERLNTLKTNALYASRMYDLGFTNTPTVKTFKDDFNSITKQEKVLNYYKEKYPDNIFITRSILEEFCKNNNLVCGEARYFIEDIPVENLEVIEKFKLAKEDAFYTSYTKQQRKKLSNGRYKNVPIEIKSDTPQGLFICAPEMKFDRYSYFIVGSTKKPSTSRDPIVLHSVNNGYLVITNW